MKYIFIFLLFYSFSSQAFIVGVGVHVNKNPDNKELDEINRYGFQSIRDDITWSSVEQEKGVYTLNENSNLINILNNNNKFKDTVVVLGGTNKIYDNGQYPDTAESRKAFLAYISFVARKLKGKVTYYDIWNEWTHNKGVFNLKDPVNNYYEIIKESSEIIKSIDPSAKILAGSLDPIQLKSRRFKFNEGDFLLMLVKMGVMNYIDGISLHTYTLSEKDLSKRMPPSYFVALDKYHEKVQRETGKNIPFYITEVGLPTENFLNGFSDSFVKGYFTSYYCNIIKRSYIKGMWWYDLIDDGVSSKNVEFNFGVFNPGGEIKSAYNFLTSENSNPIKIKCEDISLNPLESIKYTDNDRRVLSVEMN